MDTLSLTIESQSYTAQKQILIPSLSIGIKMSIL